MNDLALGATILGLRRQSPTMASQPDEERITTCLIYDFFRAQFALKDAFFPLEEEDFHDSAIVESLEYRRTQEVLIQQGQIYIEQMHERISDQIQAFLAELHPPNEQNSFNSLSAHIFSHGIEWNLILTYFVFCAELAYQADLRRLASVRDIVLWMAQYTNQHLLPWIVDHGGWSGFVTNFLAEPQEPNRNLPRFYGVGAAALGVLSLGLFLSRS